MKTKMFALGLAATIFAAPAFAMPPNHTVKFVVPVDVSKMPYIKALTVGCDLVYTEGVVLTPEQYGQASGRADFNFTGGEFHQNVEVTINAPNGPKPIGYSCGLYVTASDGSGIFQPLDPAKYPDAPPEHLAAQGTVPVTKITGTFGPVQLQTPQQRLQAHPFQMMKPPSGQ